MQNRYNIVIDLKKKTITNTNFRQSDAFTSIIEINLVDNKRPVDITGQAVKFVFERCDGTIVTQDTTNGVTILNATVGDFQCVLEANTLMVPGNVKCEIVFTDGNNIMSTASFNFNVSASIGELTINYIDSIESKIVEWQGQFDTMKAAYDNTSIEVVESRGTFTDLKSRLNNNDTQLAQNVQQINDIINQGMSHYGTSYKISTDTMTRIGNSVGKVANANGGLNDFDNIMPWAGMRRCNLADDGVTINAYYGDVNYIEDGSNGQVMVEVPSFYYKVTMPDADTINREISMLPLSGYKYSPWHFDKLGNKRNKAYMSAFEGSIFDVSASATEVDTLTITTPCTTSGNITVRINSTDYNVAVVTADDVNTIAAKIRATLFNSYTLSGTNATVIFTCNKSGAKYPVSILTNTLGVTGTVVQTTVGAGGYIDGDAQVADFTVGNGDKLCSVAGVKPASGVTQNLTLPNCRKLANNRGAKWEQQFFTAVSMIQMLIIVEYGSLKTQNVIGQGVTNKAWRDQINDSELTGATSSLGNKSGKATGTDGLVSISYRGIENFWGNIWKWVDGFNINNGVSYISNINGNFVSDTFTGQYINVGFVNANSNGYISKVGFNVNFDYGFIPTEALGTSSSRYSDYFYPNSVGAFVALLGSSWGAGAYCGAFCWALSYGSGYRCDFGSRACT